MSLDLFSPSTEPANVSQEARNVDTSPAPWRVERTNAKGWKGVSIVDANGLAVAYMVMRPDADNEMANAKAIVAAVNNAHSQGIDKNG